MVLSIKRIREYAEEHFIDKRSILDSILKNVCGIDLNPLAVLAAKANYLIALSDLLRYRASEIEIPIYLADSIAVSRRMKPTGEMEVYLKTTVGEFWLPQEVIDKKHVWLVLYGIEVGVKNDYSEKEFKEYILKRYDFSKSTLNSILRLYRKILKLEKEGKIKFGQDCLTIPLLPCL